MALDVAQVKLLRAVWEAFCFLGLACVGALMLAFGLLLSPYFVWKWLREERTRKTLALALACLHAFTLTANATTYYVNYTTGLDTNNGTASGTAWKTISKANATAVAGDVVRIAANDTIYAHPIQPRAHNTTWIGDSTARHTVKVPGLISNKKFTQVNGVRVFGTAQPTYTNADSNGAYLHARNSDFVGGFYATSQAFLLDNCRIGIGRGDYTAMFRIQPAIPNGDSIVVQNCEIHARHAAQSPPSANEYAVKFEPDRTFGATMQRWFFSANTCTITVLPNARYDKMLMFNHIRRGTFYNNSWLIIDSTGSSGGGNTWVIRDSVKENKFTNDTYEFRAPNGLGRSQWQQYSSGSTRPDSANVWKFCTFKSNIGKGDANFYTHQPAGPVRDSFYRNVVVCNTGNNCWQTVGAKDSLIMYRNTFVNLGNGVALFMTNIGNTAEAWGGVNGRIRSTGNIFYSKGGSGAVAFDGVPTWADSLIKSDQNCYFLPIPNGQDKAFRFHRYGQGPPTFRRVGEVNGSRMEYNSTWGSPAFEDSTYDTFDADIQEHSAARGVGPSGVDAGARDYATPPPSVVTSLEVVAGTSESITLTWTAPGENGDVGTATSYTFKYSTTEFTAANFGSNGSQVSTASPQVAGSTETVTVENLAQNTTYYFALKASNASVTSAMSNVASGRTFPAGSIEP